MQTSLVKPLNARELAAWRGFLRVHAGVVHELDRDLEVAHGLPLTQYEVLLHLEAAPLCRLRMSELARSVLLSQSGVTRLVDRLERAGLVVREHCPEDRRVSYASLTPAGLARIEAAVPVHLQHLDEYFVSVLTREELEQVGAAMRKVRDHVNPGAVPDPDLQRA